MIDEFYGVQGNFFGFIHIIKGLLFQFGHIFLKKWIELEDPFKATWTSLHLWPHFSPSVGLSGLSVIAHLV